MSEVDQLLSGDGPLAERLRAFDWSGTGLGPYDSWPASLRSIAFMVLENRFPMTLWWGPDLLHIYNRAYVPVLAGKHPDAMGAPGAEVWHEIWPIVGPQAEHVMRGDGATWNEHLLLPMQRKGFLEETYFTFSYSPLRDDAGAIGGVLITCQETTAQVQGERQQSMLRDLGAQPALGAAEEVCTGAAEILGRNDADLPFALLYLLGEDDDARLIATAGLEGYDGPGRPPRIDLSQPASRGWPLADAVSGGVHVVDDLRSRVGPMPSGRWEKSPERAVIAPLTGPGHTQPYGFLVAGVSPLRELDERYQEMFRLAADQIVTGIASARAFEEERERAEALAEIDRAKTAFFSNVSHEFRTPLTLMLGPLEEALSASRKALEGDDLEVVHRNGLRLLKLVNTLLDFSRIEAGRIDASYEPTELSELTAELASMFRSAVEKAGLSLHVDCAPLDEPVYVDREMWEKIVLNLLSNAMKHTFEGEIEVAVRPLRDRVELTVRDTGIGVPEEELPRLFERFHRVEGARARTHEGSGIGLALVRELVELHGGTVDASSRTGEGTTFGIRIPRGPEHLPADRIGAPRRLASTGVGVMPYVEEALRWLPHEEEPAEPLGSAREVTAQRPLSARGAGTGWVLVVDDNADLRDYLRRILQPHWHVETVRNGEIALERIQRRPPDLVLADVMMPGLDGFELLQRLRADRRLREIPVILLSARAGEAARTEGIQAGADDYLIKPFSPRELVARVGTQLELARVRRESAAAVRESERRFRALVTATSDMVYRMSPDWSEMWELDGREILFDTRSPTRGWLEEYIHPDDQELVRAVIAEAIRTRSMFVLEHRVLRADGSVGWTFSRALPLLDDDGEVVEWFGAASDITERKQAEERLREANRRKDDFLAMLGHELRNPLSAIHSTTELMKLTALEGERLKRAQGVLERQTKHMIHLIDGLLELTRIARGKINLDRQAVDARQVVERLLQDRQSQIESGGLVLEHHLPSEPVWVWGDPVRLTQVVDNLVGNAIKFTDPPGTIEVSVRSAGGEAVIRVRDTGVGILPEMLEHLFEPFQQEPQELARSAGGLGLGLALAKRLVELHDGCIEARSPGRGEGAELEVRLPTTSPPREQEERDDGDGIRPLRILVVEDNVDAGEMLRELLEMFGHRVTTVERGAEGLEVLSRRGADIVLCDLGLPGMSGFDVARAVRGDSALRDIPLVALTGYGQAQDRQRSAEAGFDDHLTKPVTLDALHTVLRELTAEAPGTSEAPLTGPAA